MKKIIYLVSIILLSSCAFIAGQPEDNSGDGRWVNLGSSIIGVAKKYEIANIRPSEKKEWIIKNFPSGAYRVGFGYSESFCKEIPAKSFIHFSIRSNEAVVFDGSGLIGWEEFSFGPPGHEKFYSFLNRAKDDGLNIELDSDVNYNVAILWRPGGEWGASNCSMTLKFMILKLHFGAK